MVFPATFPGVCIRRLPLAVVTLSSRQTRVAEAPFRRPIPATVPLAEAPRCRFLRSGLSSVAMSVVHHFTVDLEDWYHVSAFESVIAREQWPSMQTRVAASTYRLLDIIGEAGHLATFFTLGWVADRHPGLIRDIADQGHEVACHTWWHRRVFTQAREEFAEDIRMSKARLEDITGVPVRGFRAPSFSITPGTEWAFEELANQGFTYDSSVFPIWRPGYGNPNAPAGPYEIRTPSGTLLEYPLATFRMLGTRLPGAGGAYLRHLPFGLVRRAVRAAEAESRPAMIYVHPWELDVDQPRLAVGRLTALRHYGGLQRTAPRLAKLLSEFRFTSIERSGMGCAASGAT